MSDDQRPLAGGVASVGGPGVFSLVQLALDRGKNSTAYAPRYEALGNRMAVNVMNRIGETIALVENQLEAEKTSP